MTFMFNSLTAKLINEIKIKNNKKSVAITFQDKMNVKLMLSLHCSHCNKIKHEKFNCFVKHLSKRKKFNAA